MQSCMTLYDFLPGFWLPPVRWSDIDMEGKTIRWRGEHKKTGYEHQTPMTAEALAVLDIPLLPAPKNPSVCVSRSLVRDWWNTAVARALQSSSRNRAFSRSSFRTFFA